MLLFPGQGAQKIGMGKDLADAYPAARETFAAIDDALGVPLSQVMWNGPDEELTKTHNTQPAILAHSAAVLAVVRERVGPVGVAAGHSLGEYAAWIAAGALTATAAAQLVRRRGELMFAAGQQRAGAMAAVLGLATTDVEVACAQAQLESEAVVVAANLNAPDQTVISGDPAGVSCAGELCQAAGAKRVIALKVSGAFHSPLMEPAVPGLRDALNAVPFGEAAFPVVANAVADLVQERNEAIALLAAQLTAPVRWVESMRLIAGRYPDARWLELGPGNVLTGLLKRIVPEAQCTALGTAAQVDAWMAS
ncbi:MAG TPA: ACP S-malonyltransferase [Gemmatimonadales bacterium]